MTNHDLRRARRAAGLSQVQAAAHLRVSQPYLAMLEAGTRRVTPELAHRAMRAYRLPATVLPPAEFGPRQQHRSAARLAGDLAALGYPGFAHLRPARWTPRNPTEVLLAALAQEDLEARLVEALPWLALRYWPLEREWLVRHAKLHDLQNRLGFVLTLAQRLAERAGNDQRAQGLGDLVTALERSRLAREDTLCRASLSGAERRWLAAHRSADARGWNLLTDWTADAVRHRT
jgi:transcriptional regulator with XRE-family HTH domain